MGGQYFESNQNKLIATLFAAIVKHRDSQSIYKNIKLATKEPTKN